MCEGVVGGKVCEDGGGRCMRVVGKGGCVRVMVGVGFVCE